MQAALLKWWLDLTPWTCVAMRRHVRRRIRSRSPRWWGGVYIWTNWHGQFLLERGSHLCGDWNNLDQFESCLIDSCHFCGMDGARAGDGDVGAAFVHVLAGDQVRRLVKRYELYRMDESRWTDFQEKYLEVYGIHASEPELD